MCKYSLTLGTEVKVDPKGQEQQQRTLVLKGANTSRSEHNQDTNSSARQLNFSSSAAGVRLTRAIFDVAASHESTTTTTTSKQMNIVHALLGQTLTVPCANLTNLRELSNRSQQPPTRLRPTTTTSSSKTNKQQQVALIVWHKDHQLDSPIYTVDARLSSSLLDAKQAAGVESLRGRAHLGSVEAGAGGVQVPALVVHEAQPNDAGVYTCTLEFNRAPTQTHVTSVQLISKSHYSLKLLLLLLILISQLEKIRKRY